MDSWINSGKAYMMFRECISQRREVQISPQKGEFQNSFVSPWQPMTHSFFDSPPPKPVAKNSTRKPVTKNSQRKPVAKNLPRKPIPCRWKPVAKKFFDSPRKPVANRAVKKSLEFSPRPTKKMTVYFEIINGETYLTKVKPANLVRWKPLKKKYWPLHFHSSIINKTYVANKIYDMKIHKTIQITLSKEESEPYMHGGKYIDAPNKPQPKTKNKATPSKTVTNIRYETNNYYNHSEPSTSNYDKIKYDDRQGKSIKTEDYSDDDSQDEYSESAEDSYSGDSQDEYSDPEDSYSEDNQDEPSHSKKYPSYIHKESHKTNDVYWN